MQETAKQVKDAIKQLPIHERAVAIALKKIFDQVKQLTRKQQQQIDSNHLSFISKFKVLQKKASDIIQGTRLLTEGDVNNTKQKYFQTEQQKQKHQLLQQKLPIQNYWYKAVGNSQFGPDLTEQQHQILKAVRDIQTNITTNQIQLVISISSNQFVESGVFHRKLVLDNGMPVSFEGEEPKWISAAAKLQGEIVSILVNTKSQQQLPLIFTHVGTLINQIVPYSLEYYLGAVNDGEEGQEGEEDDQEGEGQEDQNDGEDQ